MAERKRDKTGRYVATCKWWVLGHDVSCETPAKWCVVGWAHGSFVSGSQSYCKRHATAEAHRYNKVDRWGRTGNVRVEPLDWYKR